MERICNVADTIPLRAPYLAIRKTYSPYRSWEWVETDTSLQL
jgi:hypothetical protein